MPAEIERKAGIEAGVEIEFLSYSISLSFCSLGRLTMGEIEFVGNSISCCAVRRGGQALGNSISPQAIRPGAPHDSKIEFVGNSISTPASLSRAAHQDTRPG